MRILFVNHTSAASGAELALVRLIEGVRDDHDVAVACPPEGPLTGLVDALDVERVDVPAFEASLRLRPLQAPAHVARLTAGGVAVRGAARRFRADLLHANTPRAGLLAAIARHLGGPPVVVRAHEHVPLTAVGRPARFVLTHSASAVVAVSQDTARRFNEGLEQPLATHVYNSFDHERFDPDRTVPAGLREELGLGAGVALLGVVAQITPWKGQDTAIRAVGEVRGDGLDAHLVLVGEVAFGGKGVRYDNHAYLRELHDLVDELGLGDAVHFLGRRADVPGILSDLDLSLLPSWSEPFANVMLESMAMGTPLISTDVGGGPELVEDGVSGRLLPPRRPGLWAAAIGRLLGDPAALAAMGERARAATSGFADDVHARQMLAVYERVLGAPRPARAEERVPWPS